MVTRASVYAVLQPHPHAPRPLRSLHVAHPALDQRGGQRVVAVLDRGAVVQQQLVRWAGRPGRRSASPSGQHEDGVAHWALPGGVGGPGHQRPADDHHGRAAAGRPPSRAATVPRGRRQRTFGGCACAWRRSRRRRSGRRAHESVRRLGFEGRRAHRSRQRLCSHVPVQLATNVWREQEPTVASCGSALYGNRTQRSTIEHGAHLWTQT